MLKLTPETFYRELPTPEDRLAFARVFPESFFDLFEFEASGCDVYPNSVVVASGCCVFRRPNFAGEFLSTHPARVPFDPPDMRGVPYRDRQAVMAVARRDWWKANGWPLTNAERAWRDPRATRGPSGGRVLTMGDLEGKNDDSLLT